MLPFSRHPAARCGPYASARYRSSSSRSGRARRGYRRPRGSREARAWRGRMFRSSALRQAGHREKGQADSGRHHQNKCGRSPQALTRRHLLSANKTAPERKSYRNAKNFFAANGASPVQAAKRSAVRHNSGPLHAFAFYPVFRNQKRMRPPMRRPVAARRSASRPRGSRTP